MIQRGTLLSRAVVVGIVFGPFLAAALVFAGWAVVSWNAEGARMVEHQMALHELDARRSQAELYGPLGESWREYAAAVGSGLILDADLDQASAALTARVEALFTEAEGAGVFSIIGAEPQGDGVELIRAEAQGVMPQAGLPRFLRGVESGEPFLFVEFMDVKQAVGGEQQAIEIRLRLVAYRLVEGAQSEGAAE